MARNTRFVDTAYYTLSEATFPARLDKMGNFRIITQYYCDVSIWPSFVSNSAKCISLDGQH